MRIIRSISQMRRAVQQARRRGRRIGFVPTMGALHAGHLSLMRRARRETACVVVSIFVNPTQFGPQEDFARYPRPFARDAAMARRLGVDYLFCPTARALYPPGYATAVAVEGLSDVLCGRFRPGHFRGVATIVLKLFNVVQPDIAYFGAKDFQQATLIERMVRDLDLSVRIVRVPTVREPDGLAMSSRNRYLSPRERRAARVLPEALRLARRLLLDGERRADRVAARLRAFLRREPLARVQYVAVVDARTLRPRSPVEGPTLIALAAHVGSTRLIDNTVVAVPKSRRRKGR